MPRPSLSEYWRDQRGALSIEALFWLVLVVFVLAIFVDGTSMFNAQSRLLRVADDANRAYSVGGFFSSNTQVEKYITDRLGGPAPGVSAKVSIDTTNDVIYTTISAPATDFQIFGLFPAFLGMTLTVKADHLIEPGT